MKTAAALLVLLLSAPAAAYNRARPVVNTAPRPDGFSDSDIKLGDMNGDGLTDIVRVRKGDLRYWPGRGNGVTRRQRGQLLAASIEEGVDLASR